MHFQLSVVLLSLIIVECGAQYGDNNGAGGYSHILPRYYRTQPLQYRALIQEQPFRPPLSYSSAYREPITFNDSPVLENAASGDSSPVHIITSDNDDFPAIEQLTMRQTHPIVVGGSVSIDSVPEEKVAEDSGIAEEKIAIDATTAEEDAPDGEKTVTETVPEEATTAEDLSLSQPIENSADNHNAAEVTTTAENLQVENSATDGKTAEDLPFEGPVIITGSNAEDAVFKDGNVAETIDAANILFFNRSEISALCFQTSQNNMRNNRLQFAENALAVAQCLEDMPPQPLICNPVDIVFILDGSASIGVENFVIIKNWIRQFVNTYLDTGSDEKQSQVGVIEFSDSAFVHVPLGGYTKEKILTDIGTTPYEDGGTQIGLALNLACQEFSSELSDRSHAKNIMILLTDGQSDDQRSIIDSVQCAHSKNIDIVAIGIGKAFNESQLSFITDNKANRLFSISNFNGLDNGLAEDLCTKNNVETMLKRDESCLFPMNETAECSKSVVQENGCSYVINKCKLSCDSNSSGYVTQPTEAGYGRR